MVTMILCAVSALAGGLDEPLRTGQVEGSDAAVVIGNEATTSSHPPRGPVATGVPSTTCSCTRAEFRWITWKCSRTWAGGDARGSRARGVPGGRGGNPVVLLRRPRAGHRGGRAASPRRRRCPRRSGRVSGPIRPHREIAEAADGVPVFLVLDTCFVGRADGSDLVPEDSRFAVPQGPPTGRRGGGLDGRGAGQVARPLDIEEHGAFTWPSSARSRMGRRRDRRDAGRAGDGPGGTGLRPTGSPRRRHRGSAPVLGGFRGGGDEVFVAADRLEEGPDLASIQLLRTETGASGPSAARLPTGRPPRRPRPCSSSRRGPRRERAGAIERPLVHHAVPPRPRSGDLPDDAWRDGLRPWSSR